MKIASINLEKCIAKLGTDITLIEACMDLNVNLALSINKFYDIIWRRYRTDNQNVSFFYTNNVKSIKKKILQAKEIHPLAVRYSGTLKEFSDKELPKILKVFDHFNNNKTPYNFNSIEEELNTLEYISALIGLGAVIVPYNNIEFILKYSNKDYTNYIEDKVVRENNVIRDCLDRGEMPQDTSMLSRNDIIHLKYLFANNGEEYKKMKQKYIYSLGIWDFAFPIPDSWKAKREECEEIHKYFGNTITEENFASLKHALVTKKFSELTERKLFEKEQKEKYKAQKAKQDALDQYLSDHRYEAETIRDKIKRLSKQQPKNRMVSLKGCSRESIMNDGVSYGYYMHQYSFTDIYNSAKEYIDDKYKSQR